MTAEIEVEYVQTVNAVIGRNVTEARRQLAELDTPPTLATAIRVKAVASLDRDYQ